MRCLRLIISATLVITISPFSFETIKVALAETDQAETLLPSGGALAKQARPEAVPGETGVKQAEPVLCAVGKSGMVVFIDPQTGRRTSRPLPEQSAAMAAILKAQANRSSAGLVQEAGPRGGVSVNLRGRFRTPMMARVGKDGKVVVDHFQCPPEVQQVNETPATKIEGKE